MEKLVQKWIEFATTSPSGGNSQPWSIEYHAYKNDIKIKVTIEDEYKSKKSPMDLDGSAAIISLGCFGKTLELAANLDHYILANKSINNPTSFWDAAIVYTFQKSQNSVAALYTKESVLERRTNREPYYPKEISPDLKIKLQSVLKKYPDVQYTETTNKDQNLIDCWQRLEKLRFRNKYFIRSIVNEVNIFPKEKGIPFTQLALSPPDILLIVLLKIFKFFFYMFKFGGYLVAINKGVRRPITNASMFGLLSPKENSPSNLLSVGEAFLEYWITVNELQASLHPMCNSLLLYNMLSVFDQNVLSEKEKSETMNILATVKEKFKTDLSKPAIAFRVGYAKTVTARSPRAKVTPIQNSQI